jgi:Fe-S-cluster containining protein
VAPNPRRIAAKLDALYGQLPAIDCRGLCVDSCGPIPAGHAERERMERAHGRPLHATPVRTVIDGTLELCHECSMLEDGRCVAYDIRPMICRLWGIVANLKCPYGCVPVGGHLSVEEGYAFLAEAFDIAGWPPGWQRFSRAEIAELVKDPRRRAAVLDRFRPTLAGRRGSLPPTVIETRRWR